MKRRAGGRYLGQAPLDRGVNVLVGLAELELAVVELALYPAKAALDRGQSRLRDKACLGQPTRVREAAGDVERIKLEIRLQRGRETFEVRVKRPPKPRAPELAYGVSLFTSPSRLPSSRACSWPWTRAEVRTPIPQSLMNPAAADWSNSSPFPYVARES